jgi:ABC-type multidrug transport system permease subunit
MRYRAHAARTIARQQLMEVLINPGYYLALTAGLLIGYAVVRSFVGAVDSSGFNPALNPLSDLINRALGGAFGETFVEKLFAEGPFLFALVVAFLPVFLFLAISSVFRFGQEKSAGAVELLAYGPADGTSYLAASFLKDIVFTAVSLALIALFLRVGAALGNLVLGPMFLASLPVLFALSLAVFAYGTLCSVLSANASSALAAFLGILLVFLLVMTGSLAITGASVRTVTSIAAAAMQWISPFFYASLCLKAAQAGSALGVLGGIGLLVVLAAVLLAAAHLAISHRGVRA